jgi:hypothetical protein
MTKNQQVIYNKKMTIANDFLDSRLFKNVYKLKYNGEILYNILLAGYEPKVVSNLICQSLQPENSVVDLYYSVLELSDFKKRLEIFKYNKKQIKNK